jgi:hypothetical protein
MTQRLIKTLGIEEVEKAWKQCDMNAYKELSIRMNEFVSPYVLRYMSNKFDWVRIISRDHPIAKSILRGSVPGGFYKHIKIEGT